MYWILNFLHSPWEMALVIVTLILIIVFNICWRKAVEDRKENNVDFPKLISPDTRNWTSRLHPDTPISMLSIPGTHDSMTFYTGESWIAKLMHGFTKCQEVKLADQLNMGIRFLDIRCCDKEGKLRIYHGPVYLYSDAKHFVGPVMSFMQNDITKNEFLIIRLKQEDGKRPDFGDFLFGKNGKLCDLENILWKPNNNGKDTEFESYIPTVKDIRGKILILRDYQVKHESEEARIYGVKFDDKRLIKLADRCAVYEPIYKCSYEYKRKWSNVKDSIKDASCRADPKKKPLYCTFSSASSFNNYKSPMYWYLILAGKPLEIAIYMNIKLNNHVEKSEDFQWITGILAMDFPEIVPELVTKIIELNFNTSDQARILDDQVKRSLRSICLSQGQDLEPEGEGHNLETMPSARTNYIDYSCIPSINLPYLIASNGTQEESDTQSDQSDATKNLPVKKKSKLKGRLREKNIPRRSSIDGLPLNINHPPKESPERHNSVGNITRPNNTGPSQTNSPNIPEQLLKQQNSRYFEALSEKIDGNSRQQKTRPKSNPKSLSAFNSICRSFELQQACKKCYQDGVYNDVQHTCGESLLLVRPKKSCQRWSPIRNVPEHYRFDHEKCESIVATGECPQNDKCIHPHSEDERCVWNILQKEGWGVGALLNDLKSSDLHLRYVMEKINTQLKILLVCKICFHKKMYKNFFKAKRRPVCMNEHAWNDENRILVIEISEEENEDKKYEEINVTRDLSKLDLPEVIINHVQEVKHLLYKGVKLVDILHAHTEAKNRAKSKPKRFEENFQPRLTKYDVECTDDCTDKFDEDFTDIMTSEDIDMSGIDELYMRESLEKKSLHELYYELIPHEDLPKLLEDEPDRYKLCAIKLDGSQKATCTTLDGEEKEIEVRGRQNCGPTCNGDFVVVEIKQEQVLDAEWKKKNEAEDVQTEVTRGVVVGIMQQNIRRQLYNFVCTIDEYFSHLMIPYCGTVPKIHVRHDPIDKLPAEMKNRRVCVYEGDELKPEHVRTVSINPKNKLDKLFVVRYEKWSPTYYYPHGYVIKVLEPGTDLISGQRILNLAFQVPPEYNQNVKDRLQVKYGFGIPKKLFEGRVDCCDLNVISIDPPNCVDVDDALSIVPTDKKTKKGIKMYEVGVHIADVTEFVKKGDEIDEIAIIRKTSYYPTYGKVIHMLPDLLSGDLCSLKEKEKRLALSMFILINESGKVMNKPKFVETVVINQKKLTYTEAQDMIKIVPNWMAGDRTADDVRLLHNIAKKLRQTRLGKGCVYHEVDYLYHKNDNSLEAHNLVEEFMILANSCAAEYMIQKLPDRSFIRSQRPPNDEKFDEWQQKNAGVLMSSAFFDNKINDVREQARDNSTIRVLKSSYTALEIAAKREHVTDIVNIITMEKLHPSISVAMTGWLNMQHRAKVHRHEDDPSSHHFSLQKDAYTWFTSPIRRYMDVIVHRLIKSTIQKDFIKQDAYTPADIDEFSKGFNCATLRSRKYSKQCKILQTACGLSKNPIFIPGTVVSYDDEGTQFDFPCIEHLPARKTTVKFSSFSVCDKPEIRDNLLRIFWQRRIYDLQPPIIYMRSLDMSKPDYTTKLNHRMHTREVMSDNWREVRDMIYHGKDDEISAATDRMIDISGCFNLQQAGDVDDATSEMKNNMPIIRHHSKLSYDIEIGNVCQVQLGAAINKGIIEPAINLMSISNSLDICIEHTNDPIKCYSEVATKSCKQRYRDEQEYQETWLPMLAMEAASNTVQQSDPVIIHNVPVKMKVNNGTYYGSFELDKYFIRHRHINFIANTKDEEEIGSLDYLCLRCPLPSSNLSLPQNASISPIAQHITWRNVWVAHAHVKRAVLTKEETIKVQFDVNQSCSQPPVEALLGRDKLYTVEFLVKTLPDKRMAGAVSNLGEATDFCRNIVLGHSIHDNRIECEIPDDLNIFVKKAVDIRGDNLPLPRNNGTQDLAIRTALGNKLVIIQGPPGTGKTLTGVKLVYWFTEINKKKAVGASKRQVMYCGPSNSAVDVATKQLLGRLSEKCPKIVRVYSDMLEKQVFPIPRDFGEGSTKGRKYKLIHKKEQEAYALHHLIRKPSNPFHRKILDFDKKFRTKKPEDICDKEIEVYEKLITDASVHELPKYDVILCTCTVSACPKIKRGANIQQLIIDESGMCMEPETLVPLVCTKPEQVVLIGDHKQLRPIVINQTAKDLGLEVSMFERQASIYGTIMLDHQYRMHKEICAFPSKHFYDNRLVTIPTTYWTKLPLSIWPNPHSPTVFCHMEGEEKSLAVSTEDGNEQSKWNEAEVKEAVRIFFMFVNEYRVPYRSIIILSQYKAQCKAIEEELVEKRGYDKLSVSTVVASQGDEWDYVILSTVRSLPRYEIDKRPSIGWLKRNLGFIIDDHQINVAITRARRGLVIIGNKHLLRCDNDPETGFWGKLLKFYDERNCIVNAGLFPARYDEGQRRHEARNRALQTAENEVMDSLIRKRVDDQLAPRFQRQLILQAQMFQNQ